MKRSPNEAGRIPFPVVLLLLIAVLTLTLAPSVAALRSRAEQAEPVMCGKMCDGENGQVSDGDGHIGNNDHGADHTPDSAGKLREKLDDMLPGDGAMMPRGEGGDLSGPMGDGTADEGSSSGILPWIIGALVVLAVLLVVLALIPRRGKSH